MATQKKLIVDVINFFEANNRNGNYAAIKGKPRTGKSYLASIFMRTAIGRGWKVFTNIKIEGRVKDPVSGLWVLMREGAPAVYYITSARDFFLAYINEPEASITIFDDAQGTAMSSLKTTSGEGKDLNDLMLLWGKFQSNVLAILHEKYVPHFLLEFSRLWVYKLHQKDFYVSKMANLDFSQVRGNRRVVRVPIPATAHPLPYETYGVPDFSIELDLRAMYSFLSKWEGELRAGVRAFLEKDQEKEEEKKLLALTWEEILTAILLKKKLTDPHKLSSKKLYQVIPRDVLYNLQL